MTMNNDSTYYCKRLRTLNWLISRGFTDYEVIPDPTSHNKKYNWFVFKRTPELNKAIEEYFAQFK
jgi:hypothetical protein